MKIRATTIVVTRGFASEPMVAARLETIYDDGGTSDSGLLKIPLFDWYYLTIVLEIARRAGARVEFAGDDILQSRMRETCQAIAA